MQRELEVRPPQREVEQERPGLPLSASFLGREAYFPTSCSGPWGISLWGPFTRSVLAGQGLHGCWSCSSWSGFWLNFFPWSSSKT